MYGTIKENAARAAKFCCTQGTARKFKTVTIKRKQLGIHFVHVSTDTEILVVIFEKNR